MSEKDALRIAVGEPQGRRSSTWRVWLGPRDIYAAVRALGGTLKASIHYPRPPEQPNTLRYVGFTKDYLLRGLGPVGSPPRRRHFEWRAHEFAPDFFVEFRFIVPESELRRLDPEGVDVVWVMPPAPGTATEVSIISAPPVYEGGVPGRSDGGSVECLLERRLDNGRRIWVVHHGVPAPSVEQLQRLRGALRGSMHSGGTDPKRLPIGKNTRVLLEVTFGDGSAGFVELAADFL